MAIFGQEFSFGFDEIPVSEKMRALRDAGFQDVMLHWFDENDQDNHLYRYDEALKAGLGVHTAHFAMDKTHFLWQDCAEGEQYGKELLTAIKECGERHIENLVIHTTKKLITPPPNEIGVRRIEKAVRLTEEEHVNIAVENTRFLEYNQYLYDHVPSDCLKFCFDCGHANCFTPNEDPLGRFADRLVTTHIHDNHRMKDADEHLMPGEGLIDLDTVFRRLIALDCKYFNLESHFGKRDREEGISMQEYLRRSFEALTTLYHRNLKGER